VKVEKSKALLERALKVIPLGAQTLSKTSSQFTQKYAPNFVTSGKGPYLYDVDGNQWTDYICALGPIVLGYNNPEVIDAICQQVRLGMSYSLSHEIEIELAEKICSIVPGVEKVRFAKNGSDVTAAAIRAARAYTGREHIAMCGYHGWQDWYIGTTAKSLGVPETVKNLSHTFKYNDVSSLKDLFIKFPNQIACVIIESIGVNEPEDNFLQKVKDLAHANGALLVFDEIVNGFRLRPGGAGEYYGVTPDLIAFGKAMGNGAPISAIGGRAEVMKVFEQVFFSFTFAGDTIGIAASLKTIEVMERENGYAYLFDLGVFLKSSFNALVEKHGLQDYMNMKGLPHHLIVEFKGEQDQSLLYKSYFQQECLKRGELFLGVHFCTLAHTKEIIQKTLKNYDEVMSLFKRAATEGTVGKLLESEPVKPVFRARV
jgi:glutamate-1-semialdehyde aminotransferase